MELQLGYQMSPFILGKRKEGFPSPTLESYQNFIEVLCENKPIFSFSPILSGCDKPHVLMTYSVETVFPIFVRGLNSVSPSLSPICDLKGAKSW